MKIDANELNAVSSTASAPVAPRMDLYALARRRLQAAGPSHLMK